MMRLSRYRMTILIILVFLAAVGVVSYVQVAVKHVEEELPLRVMREKRDMEQVARSFYGFLSVTDAARVHPTEGNLESVREHLKVVIEALGNLRKRYAFDTLIGASALHSVLSPTVDDVQTWLEGGFGDLPSSSPIVLELVATRARDTLAKVYDKTTEADRIAYEILEKQSVELRNLRNQLLAPLAVFILLAVCIVWLAGRQQRVARRQAEAEAARERAQAQLRQAIESISEGFALFDAKERLMVCNTRYRDMLQGHRTDAITTGTPFETIIRDAAERGLIIEASENIDAWVTERLQSFRSPTEAHFYQLSDKKWIQINERKTEDSGTVAVYSDISELKEREFELLEAMRQAEAASEAKGAFLANVSHELRTPLTSILGFTRIIQKRLEERILPNVEQGNARLDRAVQQVLENIKIILLEGTRLTSLINNVLDLAKIEAGKMDWFVEPLQPLQVIEQAVAATEALVEEKGLNLTVTCDGDLPSVRGDRDKVVQVIVNLISNAVKFTDNGTVTCEARPTEQNEITFSIIDTGCGIDEQDQAMVFEQFRQVGETLTDKPTGTGLGLPICKEIVDHLGGRIWVKSKLNEGSAFHFTLPLAEAPRKN
jgi:signal transduction histidine kinase